jgi:hypothetical protein
VGAALVFGDYGDAVGVVAVGAEASGVAERDAHVVAEFGAGEALGAVFVIGGGPFAGEVYLGVEGEG